MSDKNFFQSFAVCLITMSLGLFWFHSKVQYQNYVDLSMVGVFVYTLLTFLVFKLAKLFSGQSNDKKYLSLVFANVSIKFFLTVLIPVVYFFLKEKPDGIFVIPFLFIYICFTIYETWLLNKMAIMRK